MRLNYEVSRGFLNEILERPYLIRVLMSAVFKPRKYKAFTLVECIISLLLITIVLVGGMAFYFYSNEMLKFATHKRIAAEIANTSLEALKNDINVSLSSTVDIGYLSGTRTVAIQTVSARPYKQVQVQISWPEPNKATQSIIVDTFITP